MRNARHAVALIGLLSIGACTVGPDYKRPALDTATQWPATEGQAMRTAGERWWESYGDPALNALIDEALQHNYDLHIAVERVNEAQAQARYTGTDNAPNVNARAGASRTQFSEVGAQPMPPGTPREQTSYDARIQASYEIDFFGKYRRGSEAARAELLASEAARRTIEITLARNVAQQYFAFVAAEAQEQVLRRTVSARQEALDLDSQRFSAGVTSEFHLLQTQAEVAAAQSQLAQAVMAREQHEAGLLLLVGRSPRAVLVDALTPHAHSGPTQAVWVPDGLPSELLLRRPDVVEAEQKLIAANARIGNIRAAVFPAISLTGYLGSESVQFSNLFSGPAGVFQFAANLAQPIFQAGRTDYALKVTEARFQQTLASYQKSVASAFYDVRNALAAQRGAQATWQAQSRRVDALSQAYQQALSRLQGGVASRIETLDTERQLLQAQLAQIDAERAQRDATADLFVALGGGWTAQSQ